MINKIWTIVARVLAKEPIAAWIVRSSRSKPYYHLPGYVNRYWATPRWMLKRDKTGMLRPKSWVPYIFRVRLHCYVGPDKGRHLHDHPADSRTVLLAGQLLEVEPSMHFTLWEGQTLLRRAEDLHKLRGVFDIDSKAHRLAKCKAITLWWRGHSRREWGFQVGSEWVHHEIYSRGVKFQPFNAKEAKEGAGLITANKGFKGECYKKSSTGRNGHFIYGTQSDGSLMLDVVDHNGNFEHANRAEDRLYVNKEIKL